MTKPLIALITGAKEGIGYQTALQLAKRNWKIILADKQDLNDTQQQIINQSNNSNVFIQHVDLASFKSIRNAACDLNKNFPCLDVAINNAGIFRSDQNETEDQLNYVLQVNHFGPYFLTCLIINLLKTSSQGRIIHVTSSGAFLHTLTATTLPLPLHVEASSYRNNIDLIESLKTYYNTKLCNMIVTQEFTRRLSKYRITSNCLHPGMTSSGFLLKSLRKRNGVLDFVGNKLLKIVTQDVKKSASLVTFLATSSTLSETSGEYFVNYQIHRKPELVENQRYCKAIWQQAECLVPLLKNEKIRP